MKILYNETARGVHAIMIEFFTREEAYKRMIKLKNQGYTLETISPRLYWYPNGKQSYIINAFKSEGKSND